MKQILEKIKKTASPTKKLQQEKTKIAKLAFDLVRKQTSKYPYIMNVEFGGSYSKGTWLPDKADIDIFIKFEKSVSDQKFIEISKKIGFEALKKFKPYVRYSDHPYVEAEINRTKVNVVPCYNVKKGDWKSAADRSPFHTQFMLESLTGTMKNEIRILKVFLKNNGIYGSEIAKQGFSGYVVEVLIWNFGSFKNVINTFSKIKQGQIIGKATKKFDTPIIIIDPIDSNRNLAAAISIENISKFVLLCRAFLEKPSVSFFQSKTELFVSKEILENVVLIQFNFKPRSPDIIWGQIKRASNSLSTQMDIEDFKVLRKSVITDEKNKASLLFLLQSKEIDEFNVRKGPEFFSEFDSKSFIKKNRKKSKTMWLGTDGRILSLQKREFYNADLFLRNLLKNHLNKSGIPKGLKNDFKKGFKVLVGNKIKDKSIKEAISELVSTNATIFSSFN